LLNDTLLHFKYGPARGRIMSSVADGHRSSRRIGAYAVTAPVVGLGLCLGLLCVRADAPQFSITPLALAVALCAWHGGLGPGLFALVQATLAIDFFFIAPGTFLHFATGGQAAAFFSFIAGWLAFCVVADRVVRQTRRDRQRRVAAEAASAQAHRLTQLTAALAQARTPRSAVEAIVQESLHALKADAGMLLLASRDGERASVARAVGYGEGTYSQDIALSEKGPISDAVARGAPVILESRADRGTEYPAASEHTDAFEAMVLLPLLIGSRVVAIVQLEFEAPHVLSLDDREYLIVLGTSAAQALDRTWQLEYAERARSEAEKLRAQADQELVERKTIEHALRASETRYRALAARTSRLHALSAALSEAVSIDAVARAVIHHGCIVVGATAGEVTLLVENGSQFETLHLGSDLTPRSVRAPVEDGLCATEAVQTARPVFIKSLAEWQERYWRSASVAADGGYQSSATMPLLVEGAPIGVLAFHFTVPVNFDDDYQALLTSVAQHCAQALDRARLYESTQRARSDAEKANRIKDEFVSIVSHELRTPLNAILGWTTMLQRGSLGSDKAGRALQSIADNASRQARLIEDLLDFSRVSAGRASLEMETVDIRELIRGVVESMTPTAVARAVDLQLSSVPPVEVLGDIRRLEQVFFNLVDNALKFTPKGGRVTIDVRIVDGVVEVQVQDNGRGIEPDFLPLVFERFRQADSTSSRAYGGLGLGLSIAKQLVEAHKGSISAESEGKDHGATFTVRLPAAAQRPDEFAGPAPAHADLVRGSSSPAVASRRPIVSRQTDSPHESDDRAADDMGGIGGLFSAAAEFAEGDAAGGHRRL
jgi:signal transduction histidine kinase